MEYTIPTTKDEMYATLREIYQYYHFRQLKYDGITLEELNISRLDFTEPTAEEAQEKARLLLAPEHTREVRKTTESVQEKIVELKEKLATSSVTEEELIKTCTENYDKLIAEAKRTIWESGVSDSSVAKEKISQLHSQKAKEIASIRESNQTLRAELQAKITAEEEKLNNLTEYFSELFEKDVLAKADEILDENKKTACDVKKYNNGLDEKEARYRNSLKSNVANLELRYLSIHEQGFAHDELVEMGYYDDVIGCVSGYYNALDAGEAYVDIKDEQTLVIYLDSYYATLVQVYKIRSATDET